MWSFPHNFYIYNDNNDSNESFHFNSCICLTLKVNQSYCNMLEKVLCNVIYIISYYVVIVYKM